MTKQELQEKIEQNYIAFQKRCPKAMSPSFNYMAGANDTAKMFDDVSKSATTIFEHNYDLRVSIMKTKKTLTTIYTHRFQPGITKKMIQDAVAELDKIR